MEINEEDIFKYVLFTDELEPEKKDFLKKNEKLFSEQIELCKASAGLTSNAEIKRQTKQVKEKIFNKIFVVELYPVQNQKIFKDDDKDLAAANAEEISILSESITFSNEDSKYLVRIINNKGEKTLYFFSNEEEEDKKFKITLLPDNKSYHITHNSQQIEIDKYNLIQKILVEEE